MAKKPILTPEAAAPASVVSSSPEPVTPVVPEETPPGVSSEITAPVIPPGPVVETGMDLAIPPDVTAAVAVDLKQTSHKGAWSNVWDTPWPTLIAQVEARSDGPALKITAKTPRRRAGRRFTSEPTTILLRDLKEYEIRLLREDMELSIQVVDVTADGET